MKRLTILNPKRQADSDVATTEIYTFYPGFSENFAKLLIQSAALPKNACIIDPWNGSGTTTTAATMLGMNSRGFDLNPAMVMLAKARQLKGKRKTRLKSFASKITRSASQIHVSDRKNDPLSNWFSPQSVRHLRKLDRAIQLTLIEETVSQPLAHRCSYAGISDLVAFYYVALFRTVRVLLTKFSGSNPTWIKKPRRNASRLRPKLSLIKKIFQKEVDAMLSSLENNRTKLGKRTIACEIDIASSDSLPVSDRSVDLVLTSPPYCTRIDYAVATAPELAVLGYNNHFVLEGLRKKLIGTSMVNVNVPPINNKWGKTCVKFLTKILSHKSKASRTYYYKNHVQYFQAVYESLGEISRCLKKGGRCVIVVQGSYYKELHNDLPKILIEMARQNRLRLKQRKNFRFSVTMAWLHPGVRARRNAYGGIESVLCFRK